MSPILWRSSIRYSAGHPWQFGLSVLGIALGVAVVIAVDLSNESARRAFSLSTDAVMGKATHQIVGGSLGLDEDVYLRLRKEAGLRELAPVVEGYVAIPGHAGRIFTLLGVDPFAEAPFRSYVENSENENGQRTRERLEALLTRPGAVLISAQTAEEMALSTGDDLILEIGGKHHHATVVALLHPQDRLSQSALSNLLIADISTGQELLGMVGRLSRIDLVPAGEDTSEAGALSRIQRLLPEGVRLERAASRSDVAEQMTRAFSLNLTMLSLLALVVGSFLIYNTMTFSVIQRRTLMGTLRALGVTRREVFTLVLMEACLVGLVGTLVGMGLGVVLAQGLVRLVTRTINDLYFIVAVRETTFASWVFAKGTLLGLGASAFAALVPAAEATRVPPRAALNRSVVETRARRFIPWAGLVGLGVLLTSAWILTLPNQSLGIGFIVLFAIVAGFSLLAPGATAVLVYLIKPVMAFAAKPIGPMATRGVTANLSRTAVAITALMVALATTVGVGVMVDSFRRNVSQWLDVTLQADIYVSLPFPSNRSIIEPELVSKFSEVPGIVGMSKGRRSEVMSATGPVELGAFSLVSKSYDGFLFIQGEPGRAWGAFESQDAVLATEPYAQRHALELGALVSLLTDAGWRYFSVAGIVRDYGSERGALLMSRATFDRYWDAPGHTTLGLYATPEEKPERLIPSLRQQAAPFQNVIIRSNRDLREASLDVFDRTFTVTVVLRVLAIIVALIGILSALMALQLERAREIAVLRAQGMTTGQVWGLMETQTGVMGFIAGVLALPLGLVLAMVLVHVINRRSFGWSLELHVDPAILAQTVSLAVIAALVAGIYPALKMAGTMPAAALRAE